MTVEFRCPLCQQRLSAREEKIGREVRCPRCKNTVVVPRDVGPRDPGQGRVLATVPEVDDLAGTTTATRDDAALHVTDSVLATDVKIETPTPPAPALAPAPQVLQGEIAAGAAAPVTIFDEDFFDLLQDDGRTEAVHPPLRHGAHLPLPPPAFDVDFVAVPRWQLIIHGVLLGMLPLLGLALGYAVGIRDMPRGSAVAPPVLDAFAIEGRVTWVNPANQIVPDDGAVVLIFPRYRQPQRPDRPAVAALGPLAPLPDERSSERVKLADIGGAYARVLEKDGSFRLTVPRPGDYFALIISRRLTTAPASQSSAGPPATAQNQMLAEIDQFITDRPKLLENQAFQWRMVELVPNTRLDEHFGR